MTRSAAALADPGAHGRWSRMSRLADPGTLAPLPRRDATVVASRGRIGDTGVLLYCTEDEADPGALSADAGPQVARLIDLAVAEHRAVIGIWATGTARPARAHRGAGAAGMADLGRMFAAMVRASGRVLQISVVLGPAGEDTAYGPALTDFVIGTGHDGGRTAHITAATEDDAFGAARRLTRLVAEPGRFDLRALRSPRPSPRLDGHNVRLLLEDLFDDGLTELHPVWATEAVTGLGRLGGRTVGVLAGDSRRFGAAAADKAMGFLRLCDSFLVPLLAVSDEPGDVAGPARAAERLGRTFAELAVPRVVLLTRGADPDPSYSRRLGPAVVLAWPGIGHGQVIDPAGTRLRVATALHHQHTLSEGEFE